MIYYVFKTILTALIIVLVSEIAKKSSLLGAIIISLPITSLLAFVWLYWDTRDSIKVINLSYSTLVMVIPSLVFFIALPIMLKLKNNFSISIIVSILLTSLSYYFFIYILKKYGLSF